MTKCTHKFTMPDPAAVLEAATDAAGNLMAVARATHISRRRLGKIKAGDSMHAPEYHALKLLATGKLRHVG